MNPPPPPTTEANPTPRRSRWLSLAAATLLLAGMGLSNLALPSAQDAAPYHRALLKMANEAPIAFGRWSSVASDLPESAIELLKPNAIVSRSFTDNRGHVTAHFVLVQCQDARDLGGHWPPNCYKTSGYTQTAAEPRTWQVNGMTIPGVSYRFERLTHQGKADITVDNFMILPGVGFMSDMSSVRQAGGDFQRRYFGAAQVQIVTSSALSHEDRDTVFAELVAGYEPILMAIAEPDALPQTHPTDSP